MGDQGGAAEALAQRRAQRHRLAAQARLVDGAAQEDDQLVELEGLGQVVVGALADRLDGAVDGTVRGHDQHRPLRLQEPRLRHQRQAVHLGHAQIGDQRVEALLGEQRQRLVTR